MALTDVIHPPDGTVAGAAIRDAITSQREARDERPNDVAALRFRSLALTSLEEALAWHSMAEQLTGESEGTIGKGLFDKTEIPSPDLSPDG